MGVCSVTLVEAHPASTAIAKMNPVTFGEEFMADHANDAQTVLSIDGLLPKDQPDRAKPLRDVERGPT
jgi:hypothetical protein